MVFPLFGGFSPILPPAINTAVLSLFQEAADPERPSSGIEREALELRRAISFDVLHRYFEAQTHSRARKLISEIWEHRERFCLYLRNFGFGAKVLDPLEGDPRIDGPGTVVVDTKMSMADERFQRVLVEHISTLMPVLGIENPALEMRSKGGLPRLSLDNDSWKEVVADLVAAAEAIILYFDHLSARVREELTIIRRFQRQQATIIVRPIGKVADELKLMRRVSRYGAMWSMLGENEVAGGSDHIDDFPVSLDWDESVDAIEHLREAVAAIPPQRGHVKFTAEVPAPAAPRPPEYIQQEADYVISAGLVLAGAAFDQGIYVDAEDKLAVCIAMAFWSDDPEARAMAFLWFARVQFRQQKVSYAVENLGRSVDIFERLVPANRLSFLTEVFAELMAIVDRDREQERARILIERIVEVAIGSPQLNVSYSGMDLLSIIRATRAF